MELVLAMGIDVAILIAAGTAAAASAASAGMSVAQGQAQSKQMEFAAEQEKEAAKTRTDQRLTEMRQLRSSQTVAAAGAGVSQASGSWDAIQRDLDSQVRAGQYADDQETEARVASYEAAGKNARTMGYVGAGVSLLEGASSAASLYGRMPSGQKKKPYVATTGGGGPIY